MATETIDCAKARLPFLDSVRGLAILAVFIFHCVDPAVQVTQVWTQNYLRNFAVPKSLLVLYPATYGWAGVAMFFVVSGFCIHLSHLKNRHLGWRTFYIRRFFRIYPPYLFALLLAVFVIPVTRLDMHTAASYWQFLAHVFLMHNWHWETAYGIVPSYWSIAVEAQLYLLYPWLLRSVARRGWHRTLIAVGCVEVLLRTLCGIFTVLVQRDPPAFFSFSPFYFWFSWSIGAALADAFAHNTELPFRSCSRAAWLGLLLFTSLVEPLAPLSFLFASLLTVTVIAKHLAKYPARRERDKCQIPGNGTIENYSPKTPSEHLFLSLRPIGLWSYSGYLLHQPVMWSFFALIPYLRGTVVHPLFVFFACASTFPFAAVLAGVSFKYCELPSLAIGQRLIKAINNRLR